MEHLAEVERFHRVLMASLHESLQPRMCVKGTSHTNHHREYFFAELRKIQDVLTHTDRHLRNYHTQLPLPEVEPTLPTLDTLEVLISTKPEFKHQFRNMRDLFRDILQITRDTYKFERTELSELCRSYAALGQSLTLHLKDTLSQSLCEPLSHAYVSYSLEPSESHLRSTIKKLTAHQTKLYAAVQETETRFLPLLPSLLSVSQDQHLLTTSQAEDLKKLLHDISLDIKRDADLIVTPRLQALCRKTCTWMHTYLLAASSKQNHLVTYFKDMESKQRQATQTTELAQENLTRYYYYLRHKAKGGNNEPTSSTKERLSQMYDYDKQRGVLQESCNEILCKLRELNPKQETLKKEETKWTEAIAALETWKSVKRALIEYTKEERSILNHYKTARWNYYRTIQDQISSLNKNIQLELDMYLQANTKLVNNLFAILRKKHQFTLAQITKKWEDAFTLLNKRFKHLHVLQDQTAEDAPSATKHIRAYETQCGKTIEKLREYAEQRFNHDYYSSLVLHMGYARHLLSTFNNSTSEVNRYLSVLDKFCEHTQAPYVEATSAVKSPLESQIKEILTAD